MQYRMKTHPLTEELINQLLERTQTGSLATINADGTPYVTPMHFVYQQNTLYAHGLPKGQKISNLTNNPRVCFCVYEMDKLLLDPNEKPCDTNTKYESVIISGNATLLKDIEKKEMVLKEIVKKYTPHLADRDLPANMVKGTAVIQIDITEITGKYYD